MTTTQRPQSSFTETHHGSLLVVHVLVSLGLWFLIYAAFRTFVLS